MIQVTLTMTNDEYLVCQQMVKDTTERHLAALSGEWSWPNALAPSPIEVSIIRSAMYGLRRGFGLTAPDPSKNPVEDQTTPYDIVCG